MILSPDDIIGTREWSPRVASEAWALTRHVWITETNSGNFDRAIIMVGLPGSGKSTVARKLDDERTLILDSTMTVASRRMEYVALSGVPVMYVYVKTSLETCIKRQEGRTFPVPEEVIRRTDDQMTNPEYDPGPQGCTIV